MQSRLFDILDSFSKPFLLLNDVGDILRCNSGFNVLINKPLAEELNILQLVSYDHQESASNISEICEKLKEGIGFFHRIRLIDGRGDSILVNLEAVPYPTEFEDKTIFLVSVEEIEENAKADQHLTKLVGLLNKTQKISKTGGWELNVETGHTVWTEGVYRIHEVPLDFDHNKEKAVDFYHPDDKPILIEALEKAVSTRTDFDIRCRFFTAKGKLLYVRVTGQPVIVNDQVTHMVGVFQDITQEYETEEGLKMLNDRFQIATRAAKMGVWDFYPQQNVLHWDETMYQLYGVKKEDFSGAYDAWSSALHPDSLQKAQKELELALLGIKDFNTEFEIVLPDGTRRILAGEAIVRRNEKGEAVRITGVNYDITDRKQVEAELIKAKETAEYASRAKSDFLSTMSHEIRTPLNAVIGISGLLDETQLDKEQKDLVKTIRQGGQSLLSVINDILDFSKIESGKIELEETEFDLATPVIDVIDLLSNQAFSKGISLNHLIEEGCNDYYVGDIGRLRQILVNLVGNAIKFTMEGEVTVKLRKREDKGDHDVLEFAIADTGIGIAPEKMNRLFKSFSQVDASTTRKFGGTGLGLAITQKLVNLLGGKIWVESEEEKGTTFWFTVSLKKTKTKQHNIPKEDTTPELDLSNYSILLVEDNIINQKVAQKMLRKFNANIELASNGQEALEYVCMRKFDLVFMDMQMPVMDGVEATYRIRGMDTKIQQPIILAMTANNAVEDRNKCIEAGMDDFICKPITLNMIRTILQKWLCTPSIES